MMNTCRQKQIIAALTRAGTCVLCGAPARSRCIFAPDDSREYGAPKGKTRVIVYGLCAVCKRPSFTVAVEAKLKRQLRGVTP